MLIKILDTFTNKFAALNLAFPGILKQAERKKNGDETSEDDFDFEKARSIHTASSSTDIPVDPAKGTTWCLIFFSKWECSFSAVYIQNDSNLNRAAF